MKIIYKIHVVIALIVGFNSSIIAQNISFSCSSPGVVEVGEQFTVNYKINAQASSVKPPSFANFEFIGGPSQSSMFSSSYVNGKSTSTTEYTYSYYLQANKAGKFTIEGATATIGGKNYKSNAITIEVAGGSNQNKSSTNNSDKIVYESNNQINENTFLLTTISKKNLFQGESALLTITLYTKERLAGLEDFKPGQLTSFWKEDIDIGEIHAVRENYNGQVYNAVLLSKMLVFPQKSGKLQIPAFKIKASIQAERTRPPRDYAEQMWYGNKVRELYNKELELKSNVISLQVKELPQANKPISFNGLVGNFTLNAKPNHTEVKANEAINFSISVSGEGNLNLLEIEKPNFPNDFEVYDPKIIDRTTANASGFSGSKSYDYLLIPRNEGTYTIPSIEISYFDIKSASYKTLKSNEYLIKVGKGSGNNTSISALKSQDEIKLLLSDIRYIETKNPNLNPKANALLFSWYYWLTLITLPLASFILILAFLKRIKEKSNLALVKNKKATKTAKKRLKKASHFLSTKQSNEFYNELSNVLWGYLGDKFNIPTSDLSMENARIKLIEKNANIEIIDKYLKTIETIEFARFAPNSQGELNQQIYDLAFSSIIDLEKSIKQRP